MNDIERLQILQKHIGISYNQLAKELGLPGPQVFYDIKGGRCGISKKLAGLIQDKYLINSSWLLTGEGEMLTNQPNELHHQVQNAVPADKPEVAILTADIARTPELDVMEMKEEGLLKTQKPISVFPKYDLCYRTPTDHMTPYIMQGDQLALQLVPDDTPLQYGEVFAIDHKGLGLIIRQVYEKDEETLQLIPFNERYKEMFIKKADVYNYFRIVGVLRLFVSYVN